MAMFDDLFVLLADVPRLLVLAWVGWMAAGALLWLWHRRADEFETSMPAPAPKPMAKPKPASRPASSPDLHAVEAASDTHVAADSPAPATERPKPAVVVGDPFGELATLLDQPSASVATEFTPPPADAPRAPADSPILSSSGSPIRRANNHEPGH